MRERLRFAWAAALWPLFVSVPATSEGLSLFSLRHGASRSEAVRIIASARDVAKPELEFDASDRLVRAKVRFTALPLAIRALPALERLARVEEPRTGDMRDSAVYSDPSTGRRWEIRFDGFVVSYEVRAPEAASSRTVRDWVSRSEAVEPRR
jgi:hypothetical protein